MNIVSLGGGVQSTALCLMAKHGIITPMPDMAIFADTGWERLGTLKHVEWLSKNLPFPVHTVQNINLRDNIAGKGHPISLPTFCQGGILRRQCTKEAKIVPIRRALRVTMRQKNVRNLNLWIGISLDEVSRMKASDVNYISHRWPLIESRITRAGCIDWMENNGYPIPPKSSCVGCPFHSDRNWIELKNNYPEEYADAVLADRQLRQFAHLKTKYPMFLHRSCQPLDEVAFSNEDQFGMLNECEGFCGI
jgi:hypothetical protein